MGEQTVAPTTTDRGTAADGERTRDNVGLALLAGLGAAVAGGAVYVAAVTAAGQWMVWLAVPVGVAVGFAVRRYGRGAGYAVAAVVLMVLAMAGAQNFVQRAALLEGIDDLQSQWDGLSAAAAPAEPGELPSGAPPGGFGAAPPPEIVPAIPLAGLMMMPPEVMAEIWEHIPEETRAQIPAERVAEVEAVQAGEAPDSGGVEAPESSDQAPDPDPEPEVADEAQFAVPRPVVECAPPPDFTQPTAAAGLGFPDGVPLFLPAADLFSEERVRGDGQEHPPVNPACFASEHLRDQPAEGVMWALGILVAGFLPARRRTGTTIE